MILVKNNDESFGFTFNNRIIGHLGNNSITSDSTALFELIKNSRDANASKVSIHFKDIGKQNAQIEVYDDGDGMSYEDVKEKWMVIGTDDRLRNNTTRKGKAVWGEMGIGRLSCQKLGKKTVMISIKNNRRTRIEFDWSRYEKSGTTEEVKFKPDTGSAGGMEKGVTLHLEKLNSRWNTKRIADFKKEISILISKDDIDDTDVLVKIDGGTAERVGKSYAKYHEHVVNNAPFKVRIKFDGESLDVETFTQVGQRGSWVEQPIHGDFDDMEVGPFKAEISHFPRAAGKEKGTTLENYIDKRIGTGTLEEFLRNNYGLYLYRDGAWMKPYGGSMDWLQLEAAARQETKKIGLKQIYGVIKMTKKENPKIKPAAHRESLQENKAYRDLKKIMSAVFSMLRDYMVAWKESENRQRREEMKPGLGEKGTEYTLKEFEKKMKKFVTKLPKDQRSSAQGLLRRYTEFSEMRNEEHEADIVGMGQMRDWEKNVATVGIAASYMARELTKPLQDNMNLVAEADGMMNEQEKKGWNNIDESMVKRSREMIETMKTNQTKMSHFMKFVDVLSQHIAQSVRNKKRATQVNVYECWKTVTDGFERKKIELGIEIWDTPDNHLTVKMDRIDLECILTHLYLNSIESLKKSKEKKKRIDFDYVYEGGSLKIKFSDNGIGIPKKKLKEIFEPFKFGHSEDNNEKHGHGLGLHIVKKIMEFYPNGTVEAVDRDTGAMFMLEFPGIKKVAT